MNMDLFYVVISCIFVFLLIVGVIMMAIDSRMDYKRKRAIAQKIEYGNRARRACVGNRGSTGRTRQPLR